MKTRITIIDNKNIERLIQSSNNIAPSNIGFVAYANNVIVGFAMLQVENKTATIKVLNVYNEFCRRGIGRQILSEIVRYSNYKKLSLFAKYKIQKDQTESVTKFYVSQGYTNSHLDDTEYSISIENWHSTFNSEYRRNEYFSFKLYKELKNCEIQDIAKICINNLNDKKYLYPYSYEAERNNCSLYIVGHNGKIYGWSIAEISNHVLHACCVYILPEYRQLGIWINLLQYMSGNSYIKQQEEEIHSVNFRVGSDNNTMNKFVEVLLKEIDHIAIDHYIITLIK